MTEPGSDIGATSPSESQFERWVEPARPKAELWRTLLGGVIAVAIWAVNRRILLRPRARAASTNELRSEEWKRSDA